MCWRFGTGGRGVHILKDKKVTRVMGWALRRQLSVPGLGFSMLCGFVQYFVVIERLSASSLACEWYCKVFV